MPQSVNEVFYTVVEARDIPQAEAYRLLQLATVAAESQAREHPGRRFYVVKALRRVEIEARPVVVTDLFL